MGGSVAFWSHIRTFYDQSSTDLQLQTLRPKGCQIYLVSSVEHAGIELCGEIHPKYPLCELLVQHCVKKQIVLHKWKPTKITFIQCSLRQKKKLSLELKYGRNETHIYMMTILCQLYIHIYMCDKPLSPLLSLYIPSRLSIYNFQHNVQTAVTFLVLTISLPLLLCHSHHCLVSLALTCC